MELDLELISQGVEMAIVGFINAIASIVSGIGQYVPNPDPFPELINNIAVDDGSIGAQVYFFMNQFFDIASILTILFSWFGMFTLGWIIQTLWNLAKAKNKG